MLYDGSYRDPASSVQSNLLGGWAATGNQLSSCELHRVVMVYLSLTLESRHRSALIWHAVALERRQLKLANRSIKKVELGKVQLIPTVLDGASLANIQ